MVKQVVFEEAHFNYLKEVSRSQGCVAGLIVGRVTSNKDYVARLIKCPTPAIGDNTKEWNSVKDVDGSWIAGHAGQVMPSLPGGISVVGVFLIAKSNESKPVLEKLKQVLYQTYKLVSKTTDKIKTFLGGSTDDQNSLFWTVIHSDSLNGNVLNCRQYDVKDNKDPGRPVEVKRTDASVQWDLLESSLHFDDSIMLTKTESPQEIFRSLQPFCRRVGSAHIVIDGNCRPGSEVLNQSFAPQTGKGGKKKKASTLVKSLVSRNYSCQLLMPINGEQSNITSENIYFVHISGTISAKAYLCPGSSISEATYSLKYDIVQSIQQRCSVLSEDMHDFEQFENSFKSFPRRVYVKDHQSESGILFSEYVLPDEPPEDCLERLKDNLDIDAESDGLLESNCSEKFAICHGEESPANREYVEDITEPTNAASRTNAILAVVATAIAAVAWMFSGLVISEN